MILPIYLKAFSDLASLCDYERCSDFAMPSANVLRIRLMLLERINNPRMPNYYYESLCDAQVEQKLTLKDILLNGPLSLSERYLQRIGKQTFVKGDLFPEWMEAIVEMPPSLMIAASLMDVAPSGNNSKDVISFVKEYLGDFRHTTLLPPNIPDFNYWLKNSEGLEDLHVHLNGTTETDVIWTYMLVHPAKTSRDFERNVKRLAVRKQIEQLVPDLTTDCFRRRLSKAAELRKKIVSRISFYMRLQTNIFLQLQNVWDDRYISQECTPIVKEMLFYIFVLRELDKRDDAVLLAWFHQYLLIKGVVHKLVVMQHQQHGFEQFQIITSNPFRDGAEFYYARRFLQLQGTNSCLPLMHIEGRFSPKYSVAENIKLLRSIENGWRRAAIVRGHKNDIKCRLSLVAHFIKEPENEKTRSLSIRHRQLRESLFLKATALVQTLKNPHYAQLICGVDAAASELDAGPEVFAPAFRYLRKQGIRHFTYHVGEDFRHLVSGLRAIVEAIEFLELQTSDRLGHCVAIGVHPGIWQKRIGDMCYIPRGEWLDDLLFIWDIITTCKTNTLYPLQPRLESEIMNLCQTIYGEVNAPSLLLKTWKLRKYDPLFYLDAQSAQPCFRLERGKVFRQVKDEFENSNVQKLMRMYHAPSWDVLNYQSRLKYDERMMVKVSDLLSVEQMMELQQIVMNKIAQRGLAVETLPTSNLRIGYYDSMDEYHLARWMSQDNEDYLKPPIVIGSDDPGIFMTNIINEYAQVYCYLKARNYTVMDCLEMMDRFQQTCKIYHFIEK